MAAVTEHDQMTNRIRHPLAIVGAASALALAGCFSGSSSSSGDGDSNNGDDDSGGGGSHVFVTLDRLSGLDVEETRDELLFYKLGGFAPGSGEDFESGLRAIHPDHPHDVLEFDIRVGASRLDTTTPIVSGEWDRAEFDLTGIERELIAAKVSDLDDADDGVVTVDTDANTGGAPQEAVSIVGEPQFLNAGAGAGFVGVAQSPEAIDSAQIIAGVLGDRFLYSPGMGEDQSVPEVSLGDDPGINSVVSVRDIENLEPMGWLTVGESGDGTETVLQLLDTGGDLVGNVSLAGDDDSVPTFDGVAKFGEILPDGSYYLVLIERDEDDSPQRRLWHYVPDPDGAGTVEQVTDDEGNVADINALAGGLLGAQSNRVAYGDDGALFFSGEPGFFNAEGHSLYRVEGTSLELVTTSGDDILSSLNADILFRAPDAIVWITRDGEEIWKVSLDGAQAQLLADDQSYLDDLYGFYDRAWGGHNEYETPVRAASDAGWIFYTAKSTFQDTAAVMHNIESGELVAVDGAEWVGSSSDGSLGPAGFLGQGRLSEVFLMKTDEAGGPILGVVDAADPKAGMVELGRLPTGTEAVRQGHIADLGDKFFAQEAFASGPHRLLRAELEGDDHAHVIYVDVREEDSLEEIVNSASPDSYPVSGY